MRMRCYNASLNNKSTEKMKSELKRLKLKQLEKESSKSLRKKKKDVELRMSMLKTSEMNSISKNLRNKPELENAMRLKNVNARSKNFFRPKNTKED